MDCLAVRALRLASRMFSVGFWLISIAIIINRQAFNLLWVAVLLWGLLLLGGPGPEPVLQG